MAGKQNVRVGRVLAAMAIIVVTLFGADGLKRSLSGSVPTNIKISGSFKGANDVPAASTTAVSNVGLTETTSGVADSLSYIEQSLTAADLAKGSLAVFNEEHPFTGEPEGNMVYLSGCMNECYTIADESIMLNEKAAEALNELMADYNEATELTDFIVYGTTDTYTGGDSFCPRAFEESGNGKCVDLALNGAGTVLTYDGMDAEGWVVENCWKYGFIVRYPSGKSEITGEQYCPWHLRYVGKIHAAIMHDKELCIEEYLDYIKDYTIDEPLLFISGVQSYAVYCKESEGDVTSMRVPLKGAYDLSGDNSGRFIVAYERN